MLSAIKYKEIQHSIENFIEKVKNTPSSDREESLTYAYPCDNYLNDLLTNKYIQNTLCSIVDYFYGEQFVEIKHKGQYVTSTMFPRLYSTLQYCCNTLQIKECPSLIVTSQLKGLNALSVAVNKNSTMILISKKSSVMLSDGELQFMIGHELGHVATGNIICHTVKGLLDNLTDASEILGQMLSDIVEVPLNHWYRCAEYTADRAGLLCCKELKYVYSLFFKVFHKSYTELSTYEQNDELSRTHPQYTNRIRLLETFSKSNFQCV